MIVEQCDISNTRPCVYNSGSEPNTVRSQASMQYINQASTTISGPQSFTSSVSRPNLTMNSPNYPPLQQQQNTSLHSHGMRPPANSYMRPDQPTYNQPRPMNMNRGPASKNEAPTKIMPIAALNPYQGMWTIKARVTAKAELRRYKNAKGEGQVFSFDLLDSDGGEIKTTCFNLVADQFYNQIEVGKVYIISKGSVKPVQKAFNHLKNEYEILLDSTSTIQPCLDDDRSIPQQQYYFRSIADLNNLNNNTILDIIGVVFKISPLTSVIKKDRTETQKRTLHIKDMSLKSVEVTLWGNFCNREGLELQTLCDSGLFPILAMKGARVSDYNGKTVGTISTSQLSINPGITEAFNLRTWFDSNGKNASSVSLSTYSQADVWKTVSQIKDDELGTSEKPDWITICATVMHWKADNFCYTACPIIKGDRQCMKKVTNHGDGKWRCESCDQTVDECDYRYILTFQICDHTGVTWATAFQEPGEVIMGVSAKDLLFMKHKEEEGFANKDEEGFAEVVKNFIHTKFNFKLKVKEEMYEEVKRVKLTVVKAERIGFSSDTKHLLDLLKKEVPNFVVPKIETPIGFQESARFSNSYMGSVTNFPPANQLAQNGNHYGSSRVVSSGNIYGDVGHNSVNSPTVVNASGGRFNSATSGGRTDECYKCHQSGHWARDCPGAQNSSSRYGSGNVGTGRYGNQTGQFVGY